MWERLSSPPSPPRPHPPLSSSPCFASSLYPPTGSDISTAQGSLRNSVEGPCPSAPPAWVLPLRQLLSLCSSEGARSWGQPTLPGGPHAIICNGLVGFLLLLLWVILCWACHSRSANIDSSPRSSPNSSPGPCPEKAPPPQKPSHEGSYLLRPLKALAYPESGT